MGGQVLQSIQTILTLPHPLKDRWTFRLHHGKRSRDAAGCHSTLVVKTCHRRNQGVIRPGCRPG